MDANTPGMLPSVAAKGADESSASDRAGQIRQRNVLIETYIRTAERDIDHDYHADHRFPGRWILGRLVNEAPTVLDQVELRRLYEYMSKRYARGQDVGDDPKELARRQLHFPSNDN